MDNQEERDHYEDQDVDRWIMLQWMLRETGYNGIGWIDVDQDRDTWRALVNTVMNLRVPYNVGEVLE
jgi:choline kinase